MLDYFFAATATAFSHCALNSAIACSLFFAANRCAKGTFIDHQNYLARTISVPFPRRVVRTSVRLPLRIKRQPFFFWVFE